MENASDCHCLMLLIFSKQSIILHITADCNCFIDIFQDPDSKMTNDAALFALEDVLGGHCAVANFAIRAMIDLATRPQVQSQVREELDSVLAGKEFSLADKKSLPYLQARALNKRIRIWRLY